METAMKFFVDGHLVDQETFDTTAVFALATAASVDAGDVLGFTTEAELRATLSPYEQEVLTRLLALRDRAVASSADAELRDALQELEVTDALQRCLKALGRHGKNLSEIPDLLDNGSAPYDPVFGPAGHSVWLYGDIRFRKRVVCLSGGWAYPDFSAFAFANRAESLVVNTAVLLFDTPGFGGAYYLAVGPAAVADLGKFKDKAQSAVVW